MAACAPAGGPGIPELNRQIIIMNAPLNTAASQPTKPTLDILKTLIGFNTISRESNLGLIEWVRDYLARYGAVTRLTYDAERRKAWLAHVQTLIADQVRPKA